MVSEIPVGPVVFGGKRPLVLIAGPCVIESEAATLRSAEFLKKLADEQGLALVFKASYDKANRSSVDSFRGPGLEKGLAILKKVRSDLQLPHRTRQEDHHQRAVRRRIRFRYVAQRPRPSATGGTQRGG